MSLELPYSVRVLSTEPLDEKYLNGTIPYTSVAQVNSILVAGVRSIGLTVNIANQEYWYKDNTTDGGLILKTPNLSNYALNADVLHKTGNETKAGSLYIDDTSEIGYAIRGNSEKINGIAIDGFADNGTAIKGTADLGVAIYGESDSGIAGVFNIYGADEIVSFRVDNIEKSSVNSDGTISASPATLSNHVVVKSQLDTKADLVNGTVPASQLPSYIDDVIEVANLAALPTTGETGKIYVTIDTNKTYRWSGTTYVEISAGVIDHTLLTNIGTNTHAQIDTALTRLANTSGTNTGDQDLSDYALDADVIHTTGDETKQGNLAFLYNYNTGDIVTGDFLEGLTSIDSAPPTTQFKITRLGGIFTKTLEIEGNATASQATLPEHLVTAGQLDSADEFYFDANSIFRPNVSTYRQIEITTQNNQTFTLDFEPTFFYSVLKDGISLLQSQYVYTAPNQIQILSNTIGQTIEMTYDKFIIQP